MKILPFFTNCLLWITETRGCVTHTLHHWVSKHMLSCSWESCANLSIYSCSVRRESWRKKAGFFFLTKNKKITKSKTLTLTCKQVFYVNLCCLAFTFCARVFSRKKVTREEVNEVIFGCILTKFQGRKLVRIISKFWMNSKKITSKQFLAIFLLIQLR